MYGISTVYHRSRRNFAINSVARSTKVAQSLERSLLCAPNQPCSTPNFAHECYCCNLLQPRSDPQQQSWWEHTMISINSPISILDMARLCLDPDASSCPSATGQTLHKSHAISQSHPPSHKGIIRLVPPARTWGCVVMGEWAGLLLQQHL